MGRNNKPIIIVILVLLSTPTHGTKIINKMRIIPLWEGATFEIRNKIHIDPFSESRSLAYYWFIVVNSMWECELTELFRSQEYVNSSRAAFIFFKGEIKHTMKLFTPSTHLIADVNTESHKSLLVFPSFSQKVEST